MKLQIADLIRDIVKKEYNIDMEKVSLQDSPKNQFWDVSFNCWVLARDLKKSPIVIAEELNTLLQGNPLFEGIQLAGAYINFKLDNSIYTKQFRELLGQGEIKKKDKTIVIDYIWANVGKPLHIGHMCTPNQWQVLVNLYKKLWYDVIADSHIGDWGIIFGKLIVAYKLWWDEEKLKQDAVEHLLELYIKATSEAEENTSLDDEFRSAFKSLSEGDSDSVKLWSQFTSYSISTMLVQLERLNIEYDYDIGESFYEWLDIPKMGGFPDLGNNKMHIIVKDLINKNIATRNEDNSVGVVFDDESKLPSCILQKRDGTHGYFASDLASIRYRMSNWNPEKIIYCTDVRQQLHFKQAFYIWRKAGWVWDETELFHAYNWFISLKDGAMSTRKGKIIRLGDLLDESEKRARELILTKRDDLSEDELQRLSEIIWIGAIKYGYLKKSRETDIIFDWDEFMTFEWNSGPYIQYAYVRANNILQKYNGEVRLSQDVNFSQTEEIELIKWLLDYNNILEKVAEKNMPHILCSYIYDLTKKFSSFYNNVHILNEQDEQVKQARLQLIMKFRETIKDWLDILAIEVPEKM